MRDRRIWGSLARDLGSLLEFDSSAAGQRHNPSSPPYPPPPPHPLQLDAGPGEASPVEGQHMSIVVPHHRRMSCRAGKWAGEGVGGKGRGLRGEALTLRPPGPRTRARAAGPGLGGRPRLNWADTITPGRAATARDLPPCKCLLATGPLGRAFSLVRRRRGMMPSSTPRAPPPH